MQFSRKRPTARSRGAAGVIILVLLMGVALMLVLMFGNFGGSSYVEEVAETKERGEQLAVDLDMRQVGMLIAMHRDETGELPEGAGDLGPEASIYADDAGVAYRFEYDADRPRDATTFDVLAAGPDGVFDTADDEVVARGERIPY